MAETIYVVMKHGVESDKYGLPLSVNAYSSDDHPIEEVRATIAKWSDDRTRPVIIEDPFFKSVLQMMLNRGRIDKDNIAELQRIAWSLQECINEL